MIQALSRLKVMALLTKQQIEQTIKNMARGLEAIGEVNVRTPIEFNIGGTEARQSLYVTGTTTRGVSNYFLDKGFRHLSANTMKKGIGDSVATVQLTLAGGYGVAVDLKVYSQGA